MTTTQKLSEYFTTTAKRFEIPGAAVGIWANGEESYASHGVTSLENPLPVDRDTLFLVGSVTKTFTSTVIMRLVAEGRVDLHAPVSRYVPDVKLPDESITVFQLLNHTSGLDWGLLVDTGEGDDALARYVVAMKDLGQVAAPGVRPSYSQGGYNLLGRLIENVTGQTYERAVASYAFEPVGLTHSAFLRDDVMTRRFSVGHNPADDGGLAVARPWRHWRGDHPGGGLASSVSDLLRWARTHLDDESLRVMREQTVELRASALGDGLGLCWFLRTVDGVRLAGHGGSSNGQFAELLLVPERDVAIAVVSNSAPNGIPFNQAVVRWALETYVGVVERDPEPLPYDDVRAREIAGRYANDSMEVVIATDGSRLTLAVDILPEIRAAAEQELPPGYDAEPVGLLPDDAFVVLGGAMQGQRGYFTRDDSGTIVGGDLAGRIFQRRDEKMTGA
jgi:CubicO group peptidase (beta-lactamase class C family)